MRTLEVNVATMAQQIDSLFDNGQPGLLSRIQNALTEKIEFYFAPVSEFIKDEPRRKAHIENNAEQAVIEAKEVALNAVSDAKELAKEAIKETEKEQNRMHQENREGRREDRLEVQHLKEVVSRLEKLNQRGIGALIVGQVLIVVGGFCMAALTFIGGLFMFIVGAAWWFFTHVPVAK